MIRSSLQAWKATLGPVSNVKTHFEFQKNIVLEFSLERDLSSVASFLFVSVGVMYSVL